MGRKFILKPVSGAAPPDSLPAEARPVAELLGAIKQLYFRTSAGTIERDFDAAIDLLKQIPLPEDRQRATVYMEGLAEMRKEWGRRRTARGGGSGGRDAGRSPGDRPPRGKKPPR